MFLFAFGSGIAGGATTAVMLIAGRVNYASGAGGILGFINIVCCDLMRMRGHRKYLGLMFVLMVRRCSSTWPPWFLVGRAPA